MRRANFIVGFNNWGKSYTIHTLFGRDPNRRITYQLNRTYSVNAISLPVEFMVQSQSNDDVEQDFTEIVLGRMNRTRSQGPDLFAALCPALELRYSMIEIFNRELWRAFDEFNFSLLQRKWDGQAVLILDEVERNIGNLGIHSQCFRITELDLPDKINQINGFLHTIYY